MRQHLATVVLASTTLTGCSIIYDTSELPRIDAPPDLPIDAALPADSDLSMLSLSRVRPTTLYEGQGDPAGGSRPAVIVVEGTNLDAAANPTVEIKLVGGGAAPVEIVSAELAVDAYHEYLAVPVRVAVDTNLDGSGGPTELEITVTQDGPGGTRLSRMLGGLRVQMLPELTGTVTLQNRSAPYEYSRVAGSIIASAGEHPLRVHSRSSMQIDGVTGLDASGATGGPGGGAGAPQVAGGQPGAMGGGPTGGAGGPVGVSGLLGGAGGAGQNGTWANDRQRLPTLGPVNTYRSSGGGSGGGGVTSLGAGGAGGAGGGGGGTLHLRSDGDLTIPNSFSAAGTTGVDVSGNGGAGGNGTGGSVLVQAGGTLDVDGTIGVAGGGGAPSGKIRFDAPVLSSGTAIDGYRGPSFVSATPTAMIATVPRPSLSAIGTPVSLNHYYLVSATSSSTVYDLNLGPGETALNVAEDLQPGLNQICLLVAGAMKESDTRTCIDIVYVRPQP